MKAIVDFPVTSFCFDARYCAVRCTQIKSSKIEEVSAKVFGKKLFRGILQEVVVSNSRELEKG